jgi:hypothetical protein
MWHREIMLPSRGETTDLRERAKSTRAAIAEIDAERGARARELAALKLQLEGHTPPLRRATWQHFHNAALVLLATAVALLVLMQTARIKLVLHPSGHAVALFAGKSGSQRLRAGLPDR